MKTKLIRALPCAAVLLLDFYALPLLIGDTGAAMLLMLFVMPMIVLVTALAYGMIRGFDLILPLAAPLLFLPTLWLYYNESAAIYLLFHTAAALIGVAVGRLFYQKR